MMCKHYDMYTLWLEFTPIFTPFDVQGCKDAHFTPGYYRQLFIHLQAYGLHLQSTYRQIPEVYM